MTPVAGESAADYLRRMAVTRTNPTRQAWLEAAKALDGVRFKSEPGSDEYSGRHIGEQAVLYAIPVFIDDKPIGHVTTIVDCLRDLSIHASAKFDPQREEADVAG